MATDLFDRHQVIDVDTHLTEPPDVWTAQRAGAPRTTRCPTSSGSTARTCGWRPASASARPATTRWPAGTASCRVSVPPDLRRHPGRDVRLDGPRSPSSTGRASSAQVLYPNVGGFGNGYFLQPRRPRARGRRACGPTTTSSPTGAASPRPADRRHRAAVLGRRARDRRARSAASRNGHRAVNFCNQPQDYGQPPLAHNHWDPLWAAAQEAGVPVSFHVGGGSMGTQFVDTADMGWMTNFAKVVVADLHGQHALHRRPHLRRRVPPLPRARSSCRSSRASAGCRAPWRRSTGSGATAACARSTPSTTCCRASTSAARSTAASGSSEQSALDAIERFPDNILFESDYPHPTCQHPGPRTPAQRPRDYATETAVARCPTDTVDKVLYGNAAALYGIS